MPLAVRKRLVVVVPTIALLLVANQAHAQPSRDGARTTIINADSPAAVPDHYMVKLVDTSSVRSESLDEVAHGLATTYDGEVDHIFKFALQGFSVRMAAEDAQRLAADPAVEYVEQDQWVGPANDTQESPGSWGLDRIDHRKRPLNGAYSYPNAGEGVTVYVLDTGLRITHTEFDSGARARWGWDFVGMDPISDDCGNHGTHVAGTIAGTKYGVAKKATVVGVRVLDCGPNTLISKIAAGIDYVVQHAPRPAVINMSIECKLPSGQSCSWPTLDSTVNSAIQAGIPVVFAAGNFNNDACKRGLAGIPNAIVVGGTESNDSRSGSSNWGACVDIYAPGESIVSAGSASDTAVLSLNGTSMAAPHVTGAVALIMARSAQWAQQTPADITAELVARMSTKNVLTNLTPSDPNKLLYNDGPPVRGGSSIAVAPNADGRLQLVAATADGRWISRTQITPGTTAFTDATSLNVSRNYYSVAAQRAVGNAKVTTVALTRTGSTSPPLNDGEEIVIAEQLAPNFNNWTESPATLDGRLTAAALSSRGDLLEMWGANTLGQVWRRTQTTSSITNWSAWQPFGAFGAGAAVRSIAAEQNATGLPQVFVTTTDGRLLTGWETLKGGGFMTAQVPGLPGGAKVRSMAVARYPDGRVFLAATDDKGQVFRTEQNKGCQESFACNSWWTWSLLDGSVRSLAADVNANGLVEVFGVNAAGQIFHVAQVDADGNNWTKWSQIPGAPLRP
ncbi:hypothetical protein Ais01nite_02510 [Asanoa ishikariensis]|uniref:Serine protease, subtilisin family n=1 Tax=Asanoa ishikariensis TaxID=137265 RepID=A0A1H3TND6_9ACTN|nr:S8 family serine peptidase [Asanoa ishikariensis]GIF62216.1 hypothetical protein Ais01nite_02510 [Asanoa ishikariensis]SDZ50859.1 Serine protease, subtilisin family [Asanoa ishikariensis]